MGVMVGAQCALTYVGVSLERHALAVARRRVRAPHTSNTLRESKCRAIEVESGQDMKTSRAHTVETVLEGERVDVQHLSPQPSGSTGRSNTAKGNH